MIVDMRGKMEIKSKEIRMVDIVDKFHFVDTDGFVYSKKGRGGKVCQLFKMKPSLVCGYLRVSFCGKQRSVHRLVAEAFIKKNEDGKVYEVNHIDGNKLNNKVENLEWVTKSCNIKHAYKTGLARARLGESNNFTKLDDMQVLTAHTFKMSGKKIKDIANHYSVTAYCISRIVNGHNRKII